MLRSLGLSVSAQKRGKNIDLEFVLPYILFLTELKNNSQVKLNFV